MWALAAVWLCTLVDCAPVPVPEAARLYASERACQAAGQGLAVAARRRAAPRGPVSELVVCIEAGEGETA